MGDRHFSGTKSISAKSFFKSGFGSFQGQTVNSLLSGTFWGKVLTCGNFQNTKDEFSKRTAD